MIRRITLTIILLALLIGCSPTPEPTQEVPESTQVIESTNTPAPTTTKDHSTTKKSILSSLSPKIGQGLENLHISEMVWDDETLKIRGKLINFVVEPKDHSSQHYILLNYLPAQLDDRFNVEFMAEENTSIMIITEGLLSGSETLSVTNYETYQKIVNGEITSEIEWIYEADITVK